MSCEDLLQFDTEVINRDLAARYTALKYVNQNNYDEMKKKYSATVPGYFDGTFDDFRRKSAQLTELFQSSSSVKLSESYYRHTLSAAGAQAYAECVAQTSNKPISAWISSKNEDFIAVTFKSGLKGDSKLQYSVVGAAALNAPSVLSAGAQETLLFKHNHKQSFLVVVNAYDQTAKANDSVTIEVPAVRQYEIKKEQVELFGAMECGAGCQGNSAGCQYSKSVTFYADKDYYLLPESLKEVSRTVLGGPGVRSFAQIVTYDKDSGNPVKRLEVGAAHIDGNNGHAQGIIAVNYRIIAERAFLVEVP